MPYQKNGFAKNLNVKKSQSENVTRGMKPRSEKLNVWKKKEIPVMGKRNEVWKFRSRKVDLQREKNHFQARIADESFRDLEKIA